MTTTEDPTRRDIMRAAAGRAGMPTAGAQVLRMGANVLWELPGRVVARVHRHGDPALAQQEVDLALHLRKHGVSAVQPLLDHAVGVPGGAVTFWRTLPAGHRHGTAAEVATVLRRLHSEVPVPHWLRPVEPLRGLASRLYRLPYLEPRDVEYLEEYIHQLKHHLNDEVLVRWMAEERVLLHGDAWGGNLAVTPQGAWLIDLEDMCAGPALWDAMPTYVTKETFGDIAPAHWEGFLSAYDPDVRDVIPTVWKLFRNCYELRTVFFALEHAGDNPDFKDHAMHRVHCLQGLHGPRPWFWRPVL